MPQDMIRKIQFFLDFYDAQTTEILDASKRGFLIAMSD